MEILPVVQRRSHDRGDPGMMILGTAAPATCHKEKLSYVVTESRRRAEMKKLRVRSECPIRCRGCEVWPTLFVQSSGIKRVLTGTETRLIVAWAIRLSADHSCARH